MLPAVDGEIDQVTAVFGVFVTVAVNCWRCPVVTAETRGLTERITGGSSVMEAWPVIAGFVEEVAVTVTVCWLDTLAGAVYRPLLLIVPEFAGSTLQRTGTGQSPIKVALNC